MKAAISLRRAAGIIQPEIIHGYDTGGQRLMRARFCELIEWRAAGRIIPNVGVNAGHYLKFGVFEVRSR